MQKIQGFGYVLFYLVRKLDSRNILCAFLSFDQVYLPTARKKCNLRRIYIREKESRFARLLRLLRLRFGPP